MRATDCNRIVPFPWLLQADHSPCRHLKTKGGFRKAISHFNKTFARDTVEDCHIQKPIVMILGFEVFQFEPDITGISCAGRFTLGTRLSETEAVIQSLIQKGTRKLVLDLTHVDFVDSAGLGIIMRIFGEIGQRGGQFRIAGANAQVQRLFDITHTAAILTTDPDLVTSIKKLQALPVCPSGH